MNNRVIPALLCAAALAFACGPHPHSSAQSVTAAAVTPKRQRRPAAPAAVVVAALDVRVGSDVTFDLRVSNAGTKLLELTFPTGQTHDFAVVDAAGNEVWRWSGERMFTQSLQNKQVRSGQTVNFLERMPARDLHGTFTVIATLPSTSHAVEQRATFTLP